MFRFANKIGMSMPLSLRVREVCVALAFFICSIAAQNSLAATYTVDTTTDSAVLSACTTAAGDCSLRGAVAKANGTTNVADIINFDIPATDANCNASTGVCTITLTDTAGNDEIVINSTGGALTINGTGANRLTISGGAGSDRIFSSNAATFTLRGVTLTSGGGRGNLDDTRGGAVDANGGTTLISGVYFTGNTSAQTGGAVDFFGGRNHRVENSTFSGNTAGSACGGGICFINISGASVVNTTITGNTTTGNVGGGICVTSGSSLTLLGDTITANTSTGGGGIYISTTTTTLNLGNNIIAGNSVTSGSTTEIGKDAGVTVTSAGYNIIGDSAGDSANTNGAIAYQSTDIQNTPPLLDVLANYGGTVPTMRLQAASPAIDKGNSALAGSPALDARQVVRPYDIFTAANASGGNGADIGAFELVPTSAFGWGYNALGEVGDGTTTTPRPLPTTIAGGFTDIVSVEGGSFHALGLRSNGTLLAWGYNSNGQLGDTTTMSKSAPVAVTGLTNVVAAAGGDHHSLALLADGTVRAWGDNTYGQLGDGTTVQRLTPVTVSGITSANPAVAIAAANNSSYALLADGSVRAWGFNAQGQLGNNSTTGSSMPVQVSGLTSGVVAIDGGSNSGYALLADGSVRAWGFNNSAQLGDGTTTNRLTPVTPVGLAASSGVVQIAGGYQHAAALKADGTVVSWGDNIKGQLGNGTTTNSSTPTATNISNVTQIKSSIGDVTYARLRDGGLSAWGFNGNGAIGNGTTASPQTAPVRVSVDAGIGFFGANLQGGYAGSPLTSVAAGANQLVRLGEATVNFPTVTTAGTAQIRTFDPAASGLTVPTGYTVPSNSTGYDITSSAQFAGIATVCVKALNTTDQTTFNRLYLLHDDDFDGMLDTGSNTRDYQKREVCRTTASFSPFVLAAAPAAPTAASVSISGSVITLQQAGLTNALVTLTDLTGNSRTVFTGRGGRFFFDEVAAGETYILSVRSKRYTYAPQVITVTEDVTDLSFAPQ